MMKMLLAIMIALTVVSYAEAQEKCTKEQAKEAVLKACKWVEEKGPAAVSEIQKFRYCGDNYVWIQDSSVKMVVHPIKPKLNGSDLKPNADDNGKHLFVEFDKVANASKNGGWVEYVWPRPKAEKATAKVSFVLKCSGPQKWIAGSGVWVD